MHTGKWIGDTLPEPEPPTTGAWIARPRKARVLWYYAPFAGVIGQLPNWIRMLVEAIAGKKASIAAMVVVCLLMAFATIALVVNHLLTRRMRAADFALVDGGFGEQYPVEVTIGAHGQRLGSDRGVAWFGDGLMGFSGAAASFVLAASDLGPQATGKKRSGSQILPAGGIALNHSPVDAYVVITPLGQYAKAYRESLARFMMANERPEGERFWPPLKAFIGDEVPKLEAVKP